MKRFLKIMLPGIVLCAVLCLTAVPGILAYMTDTADVIDNPFTIALDCTTTVVEKYPVPEKDDPNTPVPSGNSLSYEKAVQVANTGYIDCYVRVSVEFSEDDIRNKSKLSSDGVNWYTVAEYASHLPAGWTYNAGDGFYYYTPVLYAEGWEAVRDKLWYEKAFGEYFYPAGQDIISDRCITTPLFKYVKTDFASPADMRSYDIHVYNESVPFYFGNDYKQSWANYLDVLTE